VRNVVQSLFDLQEMELVLTESRILHSALPPVSMQRLEQKIADSRREIGANFLKRYDSLRRNGVGVAREQSGICNACHISVNIGDLSRMRRGEMAWTCPNCARFLLLEGVPG